MPPPRPPIMQPLKSILHECPGLSLTGIQLELNKQARSYDLEEIKAVLLHFHNVFVCDVANGEIWDLHDVVRRGIDGQRETAPRFPLVAPPPTNPVPAANGQTLGPAVQVRIAQRVVTPPQQPNLPAVPARPQRGLSPLVVSIRDMLLKEPRLAARQIASRLSRQGIFVDRSAVNSELYRHKGNLFEKDDSECPLWSAIGQPATVTPVAPRPRQVPAHIGPTTHQGQAVQALPRSIPLYAWQRQALDAWETEGRRGIVEAVTGTGKTRVGMMAIRESLAAGGCVHVLVPTIDLQDQWCRELTALFPTMRIGRRGNNRDDEFPQYKLIVSVVNSAREFDVGSLPPHSLLVADECHRYGADGNARALREQFPRRLGLTATFARDDGGCETLLAPYFGETCFQMGYAQAIEDEVTAHFKVALVGVDFGSESERQKYDAAAKQGGQARHWLVSKKWAPPEPFGEFMKHVAKLNDNAPIQQGAGDRYTAVGQAREYLASFSTRRKLLSSTDSKRDAFKGLIDAVRSASRTIVFTESIDTANDAATMLRQNDLRADAIHSEIAMQERKALLRQFANGELAAICAPKVLDEGIDVPAADLAIIFATSTTRRQMVQRMGRVLRRKPDGRLARFVVLYVEGTTEDPATGAHESFIGEITDPSVAEEVRTFDSSSPFKDIVEYLNDFKSEGGQPSPRMAPA